jgi:hypothetical protein
MRIASLLLVVGLACAGCQQKSEKAYSDDVTDVALIRPVTERFNKEPTEAAAAPAADAAAAPADAAAMADMPAPPDGSSTAPRIAAGPPMLAYSYTYGLSLPHDHVDDLRRRHEAACAKAGYKVCQVVASAITEDRSGGAEGKLEIRAAPAWLQRFRDSLAGDAKAAGGKVDSSEVTSEDLSREIVDTGAQLRAKLVLRDRLQALLASRPGRLADLLAVERELARVQGEIDSTQSQLAVMQGRVAMSDVTVNYASSDVGPTIRSPLGASFRGFFGTMAASLAGLIDLLALLAPWAVIGGALFWLFRKRLPKLRWPFRRRPSPDA